MNRRSFLANIDPKNIDINQIQENIQRNIAKIMSYKGAKFRKNNNSSKTGTILKGDNSIARDSKVSESNKKMLNSNLESNSISRNNSVNINKIIPSLSKLENQSPSALPKKMRSSTMVNPPIRGSFSDSDYSSIPVGKYSQSKSYNSKPAYKNKNESKVRNVIDSKQSNLQNNGKTEVKSSLNNMIPIIDIQQSSLANIKKEGSNKVRPSLKNSSILGKSLHRIHDNNHLSDKLKESRNKILENYNKDSSSKKVSSEMPSKSLLSNQSLGSSRLHNSSKSSPFIGYEYKKNERLSSPSTSNKDVDKLDNLALLKNLEASDGVSSLHDFNNSLKRYKSKLQSKDLVHKAHDLKNYLQSDKDMINPPVEMVTDPFEELPAFEDSQKSANESDYNKNTPVIEDSVVKLPLYELQELPNVKDVSKKPDVVQQISEDNTDIVSNTKAPKEVDQFHLSGVEKIIIEKIESLENQLKQNEAQSNDRSDLFNRINDIESKMHIASIKDSVNDLISNNKQNYDNKFEAVDNSLLNQKLSKIDDILLNDKLSKINDNLLHDQFFKINNSLINDKLSKIDSVVNDINLIKRDYSDLGIKLMEQKYDILSDKILDIKYGKSQVSQTSTVIDGQSQVSNNPSSLETTVKELLNYKMVTSLMDDLKPNTFKKTVDSADNSLNYESIAKEIKGISSLVVSLKEELIEHINVKSNSVDKIYNHTLSADENIAKLVCILKDNIINIISIRDQISEVINLGNTSSRKQEDIYNEVVLTSAKLEDIKTQSSDDLLELSSQLDDIQELLSDIKDDSKISNKILSTDLLTQLNNVADDINSRLLSTYNTLSTKLDDVNGGLYSSINNNTHLINTFSDNVEKKLDNMHNNLQQSLDTSNYEIASLSLITKGDRDNLFSEISRLKEVIKSMSNSNDFAYSKVYDALIKSVENITAEFKDLSESLKLGQTDNHNTNKINANRYSKVKADLFKLISFVQDIKDHQQYSLKETLNLGAKISTNSVLTNNKIENNTLYLENLLNEFLDNNKSKDITLENLELALNNILEPAKKITSKPHSNKILGISSLVKEDSDVNIKENMTYLQSILNEKLGVKKINNQEIYFGFLRQFYFKVSNIVTLLCK